MTDPATTAEEAQRALVEAIAEALHWRGEGRKQSWAEAVAECDANAWGVCNFYREWAADALAVLSSVFIDVPCPSCGSEPVHYRSCRNCHGPGTVSRRAVDVWVDATREAM